MVVDGRLPKPMKLGNAANSTVRWDRQDVEDAIAAMKQGGLTYE